MKTLKFIFLYCSLFVAVVSLNAQSVEGSVNIQSDTLKKDILDNSKYRVYYSLKFVKDTLKPDVKTKCMTVLLIGSRHNLFTDYGTLQQDSVFDALVKTGHGFSEILARTLSINRTVKFQTVVLKNYPENKVYTFQHSVGATKYNYTDKGIDIQWTLEDEEKEIEGYKCTKAQCSYRGRKYTAWYAPDIPVSEGPYVFSGLPGLIMEIYDSQQHYHFHIAGFVPTGYYDPVYLLTDKVANVSRENVRKIIANSYAAPATVLKNLSGKIQGVSEETIGKIPPKSYNPIERE